METLGSSSNISFLCVCPCYNVYDVFYIVWYLTSNSLSFSFNECVIQHFCSLFNDFCFFYYLFGRWWKKYFFICQGEIQLCLPWFKFLQILLLLMFTPRLKSLSAGSTLDPCDSYMLSDGGTVNLLSKSCGVYNMNELVAKGLIFSNRWSRL